ncbi:unnamed protein product, partial [Musa acuminata var. zebrina]
MGTKQRSTLPLRVYADFGPQYELLREEDEDTLIVNLAGILKDQLKVEINDTRNDRRAPLGRHSRPQLPQPHPCQVRERTSPNLA